MSVPLFDIEPAGTPCLVCDSETCTCRAAGTLAGSLPEPFIPGAEREEVARLRAQVEAEDHWGPLSLRMLTDQRDAAIARAEAAEAAIAAVRALCDEAPRESRSTEPQYAPVVTVASLRRALDTGATT